MIAKGSRVRIMCGPYEGYDGTVLDEVGSAEFSFSRGGPSVRVRLDGSGTSVSLVLFDLKAFPARESFKTGAAGATTDAS
jgi:tRNA G37 N-methylase TrmD